MRVRAPGNTKKIADAMAAILDAEVTHPDDVNMDALGGYDLIGLGSGIAFGKHYQRLLDWVDVLPALNAKMFVFSREAHRAEGRTTPL